jgi:hypothetical protein
MVVAVMVMMRVVVGRRRIEVILISRRRGVRVRGGHWWEESGT